MARKPSWVEEVWETLLQQLWDTQQGIDSIVYTKKDLEPILARYTKSGQGEIRIFHSGSTKRNALKSRGLIKVPISRTSWKIVKRPESIEFKEPEQSIVFNPQIPLTEGMKAGISETMQTKSNPGETTLLAIANHAGIIADFYTLRGKGILFTGGRQKANVHLVLANTDIDMTKAQIEIDGGFEWQESAVIVEMKSSFKQEDFDVNQALIPLLKWKRLLKNKKVYSMVLLAETNSSGIEYRAYDLVYDETVSRLGMKIGRSKKYIIPVSN